MHFGYIPDLYSRDLQVTVPMAEQIYDIFAGTQSFPRHLAVDARLFDRVLTNLKPHERLDIYAAFLDHLKKWQSDYLFQVFRRFGYYYNWQGRLAQVVRVHRERQSSEST